MDHTSESYQRLVDDIYPRLVEVVSRRYQNKTGKSVRDVYRMDPDFLRLEPENLEFAVQYRQEIISILESSELRDSLMRLFVLKTLEFTFENNQFIHVDHQKGQVLERIYDSYLEGMKAILIENEQPEKVKQCLEELIIRHFEKLRKNLSRYLDPQLENITDNVLFQQVVCRQYSPEFQIKILGIDVSRIQAPVLDIGCGKSGALVKYLHDRGIPAYGIDRIVEDSDGLIQVDWLEHPLEPESYGTILSNMAFSNHFLFQHLYKNGNPEPYARKYMEILAALKPGGSFYYSPGLPFIEGFLPASHYLVIRRDVTDREHILTESKDRMDNRLYATQILAQPFA